MFELKRNIKVEWGHCDPARIVYNPHFYHWMDGGVHFLFEAAGFDLDAMVLRDPDSRGVPLLKGEALFKAPARLGDVITHIVKVTRWGGSSFDLAHRFVLGERLLVEASQTRIWGRAAPGDSNRLIAAPIPEEVKAALSVSTSVHLRLTREAPA